jgi:hypothetical protein
MPDRTQLPANFGHDPGSATSTPSHDAQLIGCWQVDRGDHETTGGTSGLQQWTRITEEVHHIERRGQGNLDAANGNPDACPLQGARSFHELCTVTALRTPRVGVRDQEHAHQASTSS